MRAQPTRLGTILTQREGVPVDPNSEYPVAGIYSFARGVLLRETITGAMTTYKTLTELHEGDVVYSKLKAFEGAIAVAHDWAAGRFVSTEFPVFIVGHSANPTYLEHMLASPTFLAKLAALSTGLGARRERVHIDSFLALTIPLPPRPDQDRIAAHLDSLARATAPRQSDIASILQRDWIGETCTVGDLVTPMARTEAADPDASYELSGVKWYGKGLFIRETKTGRELAAKTVRRVESGDLVYNRLFAWKQSFALATGQAWVSSEFPTFRVDTERVRPRVLLAALLSPAFTAAVNAASTGSTPTSRNRLKETDFMRLTVSLPLTKDQLAIERLLLAADRAALLQERAAALSSAILPAARNEIFNALATR